MKRDRPGLRSQHAPTTPGRVELQFPQRFQMVTTRETLIEPFLSTGSIDYGPAVRMGRDCGYRLAGGEDYLPDCVWSEEVQ